jgi:hypothetical protein
MWLAGCSTFERDWKAAAAATRPAGVGGAWEGEWHSATRHGAGRLKCILSDGEQSGQYQARFRATFWGFLKAGYTIRLDGREDGQGMSLEGSKDLGWMAGGVYRYRGRISGEEFSCEYESKADHGTFTLRRPAAD